MMGLLEQTNATIRDAERRHQLEKARAERIRRPVVLIDRLLQDLEELNLRGQKRVPLSYDVRLKDLTDLLGPAPTLVAHLEGLKVKIGIVKLMDALFAIQEALFVERKGRSFEPEDDDLIYAA